jgi:colicin import membrane protein
MIRKHETSVSLKAGVLAITVHVLLLVAMIVSVSWKAAHAPMVVTEVELWDKLPAPSPNKHKVVAEPVIKPVVKDEPKPEPIVKDEPKPEPVVEQKPKQEAVDIALENKKKELESKKKELEKQQALELKKQEEAQRKQDLEKLQKALRDDALKNSDVETKDKALKELQRQALAEAQGADDRKASVATQGIVDEYVNKIQAKIRGNVNRVLCADVTVLSFKVDILPTGDLSGLPRLIKGSGNSACDDAVERAIMASQPLPLPTEPAAKAKFRNLNLKFTPNG